MFAYWYWLNVYGNRDPHGDVEIVGSREALEALVRQISRALSVETDGACATDDYFDSHGEGHAVRVVVKEEADSLEPEYAQVKSC